MRHRALLVLAVSGILGFRVGMVVFPDWQVAVETAQVVAGIVKYPATTPFFLYHTKLWTLLHQVLAVFLRVGVSEVWLSLILSGLMGMVSFQALAMFVFALSDDVLMAMGAPLVMLVARASEFGVVYPILLAGSVNTYGILGLSLFVLVIGLFGAGCYRTAGFLLGVAPSIHPALGFWLFVVVGVCFVWDRERLRATLPAGLRFFVAGCLVTAISLTVHLTSAFPAPAIEPAISARYLATFVALWDAHRQPVPLRADGVILNLGALAIALVWLFAFAADLSRSAAFILRAVIVAAALSLAFVWASWIPAEKLPSDLLILMPTRVANFNAMTFAALLLGLAGAYRARWWSPVLAGLFSAGLLLGVRSLLWGWLETAGRVSGVPRWASWFDVWHVLEIASLALVILGVSAWISRRSNPAGRRVASVSSVVPLIAARTAWVTLVVLFGVITWRQAAPRMRIFEDYTTNTVFHEAASGSGLLLTGGNLNLIQLRTRRPVLLNGGGLDGLPYALDGGPEMERILRDIYAIDFFNPPEEARRVGILPNRYNKAVWEQFSPDKWRTIRYAYQVSQVLTQAGWTLNLPVIAQDRDHRLYQIPD